MALYRIDGWDYYPSLAVCQTNGEADGWYDATGQLITYAGRFGGLALGFQGSQNGQQVSEAIGKRWTNETCIVGQAQLIPQPANTVWAFAVADAQGGNNIQFWLNYEDLGIIRLYRGGLSSTYSDSGTLVATSAAKVYHVNEWDYVEVKFKIHDTAGLVEVRINTVVVLSYVGPTSNMKPPVLGLTPGWDTIRYNSGTGGNDGFPAVRFDDRYILDNTGSNNTDYLGNVRVNCQLTTAAGDLTEMDVFGAAANWDAVNERVLTETEYVYSATMTDRDLYTMDPNVTAQNILGVQVVGAQRQDDSTQLKSKLLLKTGGTIYSGLDHYLAQNYHYYRDVWELNPNTGVGWTAAQLNAIQAGQQVLLG